MINVTQQCESLQVVQPNVVTAALNTAADVLSDARGSANPRIAYRSIQNLGASNLYVRYGGPVDVATGMYHQVLPPLASWNVYTLERVSCMSDAAMVVATLVFTRPL